VALVVLILSFAAFAALDAAGLGAALALPLPRTGLDYWGFLILYASVALSYMITYSAVQADSPSMAMLLRIEASGPQGRTREELIQDLSDEILILPRLNDLVLGDLAELKGDRYYITHRGSLLASVYIRYRALLGMEKGG
jgi:hypothetical protein